MVRSPDRLLANRRGDGGRWQAAVSEREGRYLEAMTKRELEVDAAEACELPIAAGGGGGHGLSATASAPRLRTPCDFFFFFL